MSPTFCLAKGFGGDQLGLKWVMEVDGLRESEDEGQEVGSEGGKNGA